MEKITNNNIGDFFMKRKILLILAIILVIIILFPKENDEFRIRVIASSDSVVDQKIKNQVVALLKEEIKKMDQNNIIMALQDNIDLLDEKIANVLGERTYSLSITKANFPAKEVDGQIIPGGRYKTLLVVIEEGEGRNWWSLLNPDYHNLEFEDVESNDVVYRFYFFDKLKELFGI